MKAETRSQAKRRRERQADKAKLWKGIKQTLNAAEAGRETTVDTYAQEPTSCVCGAFQFAHYQDGHCILCPCGKYQTHVMIQAPPAARINPDPKERCPVVDLETALMTLEEFCKDEAFPPALREAVMAILKRNAQLETAITLLDTLRGRIGDIIGPLL